MMKRSRSAHTRDENHREHHYGISALDIMFLNEPKMLFIVILVSRKYLNFKRRETAPYTISLLFLRRYSLHEIHYRATGFDDYHRES